MERHLSKIRTPTALVTLPSHGILVIGFDSGEIQTYDIGIYDLVHKVKMIIVCLNHLILMNNFTIVTID